MEQSGRVDALDNTVAGIEHANSIGADYAEFDVRRLRDGTLVGAHDKVIATPRGLTRLRDLDLGAARALRPCLATYEEILAALARTTVGAHVDLKAGSDHIAIAEAAVAILDPARLLLTTGDTASITRLHAWATQRGVPVRLGLTVGTDSRGQPWLHQLRIQQDQLFPDRRIRSSGADVVVAHELLARARLLRWAPHHGIDLVVWTVDSPRRSRRLLDDHRAWMITTNWPARAIAYRDGPSSPP